MRSDQVVQHQPHALGCGGKPNQAHEHVLVVDRGLVDRVGQAQTRDAEPGPLCQQEQSRNRKQQGDGSEHSPSLNGLIIAANAVAPGRTP